MASAINVLLCFLVFSTCEAYKILVVYPAAAKSHRILGEGIVRPLLKAGHEVTFITAIEYKNPPANLRQIYVGDNADLLPTDQINLRSILAKEVPPIKAGAMIYLMRMLQVRTLEHKNVQKLFNDPTEQFDVVIAEWLLVTILSSLGPLYNAPFIWVCPLEVHWNIISMIDAAPNPAYTSDIVSTSSPPFSFGERVGEILKRISETITDFMVHEPAEEYEYNRLIAPLIVKRGRQPPPYSDVRFNASMILGNSHESIGQAYSLPQNYKSIGGYHIDEDIIPLSKELKIIMESNKNGVIYFSMGSNLKSKEWPEEIKTGLLKMFGNLKQNVLWKFEEDLKNVPKNVHILKWAPQTSILSHPNCVLFITHGGLLSTTETIYAGVPIIGIPVFGDQNTNVQRATAKGFALKVDLSYALVDDLKAAIQEIVNNPQYREKAKLLSSLFHDRPVKPSVELVHWVEHVVRTRGATHLRSPALLVPLYQRLHLDIAALASVVLIAFFVLLRYLRDVVCSKSNVNKQKKSN